MIAQNRSTLNIALSPKFRLSPCSWLGIWTDNIYSETHAFIYLRLDTLCQQILILRIFIIFTDFVCNNMSVN